MEGIIKRLVESKNTPQHLPTSIFSIEDRSEEAWDLYEEIRETVAGVVKGYDPDIDLDNDGLDSRGNTSGDRNIIYQAEIYRFKNRRHVSLSLKERNLIKNELTRLITLPESDDTYYYSTEVRISDITLYITLRREQK